MAAASSGSSGSAVTLADLSGVAEHSRSLAKLTDELAELLRQQASVSREVNKLLTDPSDGLNESSRRTMRSLDVAVSPPGPALRSQHLLDMFNAANGQQNLNECAI